MLTDENAKGVAGEEKLVFENPPNKGYLKEMAMIAGFIFACGVVVYVWTGVWAAVAIVFVIGGTQPLIAYWHEYLRRPKVIRIVGGGLELDFRHKKSAFVDWNDVLALNAGQDGQTMKKQFIGDGILFLRGGMGFYSLRLNIDIAAREAYNEETGKVLLNFPNEQARKGYNSPDHSK